MQTYTVDTTELKDKICSFRAGDRILLSGVVYTARDAAHKKLTEFISAGKELPIPLGQAVIYYAGPTQTPDHLPIGSCGPTTSSRMDRFTPQLLDLGLVAMIGKGERTQPVVESIVKNKSLYLCAIGGAGALACSCIKSCEVIAFEELGCESIKKLVFEQFPLFVGVDCTGNTIFTKV